MRDLEKGLVFLCLCLGIFSCIVAKTFQEDLTLTGEEKRILDQFKERVLLTLPKDYMKRDEFLIRWLRARFYNIPEAENMLSDHLRWWKENQMDSIRQEDWSDLDQDYKFWLDGRDKEGRPILYINVGQWDLRKAAIVGQSPRFSRYIAYFLSSACGTVRELGEKYQNVSQGILMLNMDGFNLVQQGCLQCIPVVLKIIVTYESHFPGCAEKLIYLNTPGVAEPVIRTARTVFHPDTNKALHVFGTDKSNWKKFLSQYFDWDELPPEIGGTKLYTGMEPDF